MKKKYIWTAAILTVLVLLATFIGPSILLGAARQPMPETDFDYAGSFYTTYDQVRTHLGELAEQLGTEVSSHPVNASDGLYIDSFYLPAEDHTNLIVLTTGVHGMEGFIGATMLDVFFGEIYPTLEDDTGVLVVANVNPYGMKYLRRYNENNVDLNRNFILDWDTFDLSSNKEYPKVDTFLGPTGSIGNALWHEAGFWLDLAKTAVTDGADTISDALLTGQYEYPQGVYYGGTGDEASTIYLKEVFGKCLDSDYENIVHIDLHSGYGPRYNMVIFNSVFETMTEAESVAAFGYDYVIAHDSEAFYATTGDTTDFFYRLAQAKGANAGLFSTCFEFGTIGDDFMDTILSLHYTIDENRNHWFPTGNATTEKILHERYKELFYPTETAWRQKTIEDFLAATNGVLNAKLR